MPICEYRCRKCDRIFQEIEKLEGRESLRCPYCGEESAEKAVLTLPSATEGEEASSCDSTGSC
jgi:putative FmdB family regulatory protein